MLFSPRSLNRSKRAFSLLEVAAAAALFAVVSIGISLAVSSALSSRASSAIKHRVEGEMNRALSQISYTPFEQILNNTFTPPSPCEGSTFLGTKGSSCITVADRDFTLSWSVSFASDAVSSSTEAVDAVSVFTQTSLPDGSILVRSRRILAPTIGFTGDSLLRVQASGPISLLSGPIFLVEANSPSTVVSSASLQQFGSALFRVPSTSCTAATPCRLALSPSDSWSTNGTVALSPTSVIGDGSLVVLTPGQVRQMAFEVFTPSSLTVELYAASDSGSTAPATELSSICLWASFNDGVADRLTPACNFDTPSSLRFESYAFDPLNPSYQAPIPPGVEISLYVDRPNGTCPNLGQKGARAGVFESAAVCTSWTWGVPATITKDSTDQDFSLPLRLDSGASKVRAVWSGSLARPAVGYEDRPLWANPRGYGSCSTTETCSPITTTAPEADLCPSQLCLSSRVPTLLGPSTGTVSAVEVTSSSTSFDLEVVDEYDDPVQVQLLEAPSSGTLFFDDLPLQSGDIITTTAGSGPELIPIIFEEDSPIDMVFFTLRLSNSVPDGVKDIEVALYRNARPWLFTTSKVSLNQGATKTVEFSITATDSTPGNGELVNISVPTGFTAPATATADSNGTVSFSLTAGSVAPGSYVVEISTSTDRSVSIPVELGQSPGSISISASDINQGSSTPVSVEVRDLLGAVMQNASVSFATDTDGVGFAPGVRTEPSGCQTDSLGTCSVSLVSDSSAPSGAYTLTASSSALSASDSFTVDQVPALLSPTSLSLRQGLSSTWSLILKDGSNSPIPGVVVSKVSTPSGVVLSPNSSTSSATGLVSFSVSVATDADPGSATVSFTAGSVPLNASFTVVSAPSQIIPQGSISLLQGSSTTGTIQVLDGSSSPAVGASLLFTPPTGLSVSSTVSDSSGVVSYSLTASSALAKGPYSLPVVVVGYTDVEASISLDIQAPPRFAAVSGSITQAGSSVLSVSVLDQDGDPISGVEVSLSGLPSSLSVSPRGLTNVSGVALLPAEDLSITPQGAYRAKLTVSFSSIPRFFSVLVPVIASTSQDSAPGSPNAPSVSSLTPSSLSVSFQDPSVLGGSSPTSYKIYVDGALLASTATSPYTIASLSPNQEYEISLEACNLSGCSASSYTTTAWTLISPASSLSLSRSGDGLAVSWSNPSGSFTGTLLRFRQTSSTEWTLRTLAKGATSHNLRALTPGVDYEVQIGIESSAGVSWSLSTIETSASRPSSPGSVVASLSSGDVSVSWVTPATGGSPITSYKIYRDNSLIASISPSLNTYLDIAPATGVRSYSVKACNIQGCSPASPSSKVSVP